MVTHAKDIVDRMKKRVITIDKGKIVRDKFGAYEESCEQCFDNFSKDSEIFSRIGGLLNRK